MHYLTELYKTGKITMTLKLNIEVSELLLFNVKWTNYSYIFVRISYIWWDDDVRFLLDQHVELEFYSDTLQSASRHGFPLGTLFRFLVIQSLLLCWMLSGETTNTNCIVVGLTRSRLEPTMYHTRDEHVNHYNTDEVNKTWRY